MDTKFQLILGGARSGKSRFSLNQGTESSFEHRIFLATATAEDEEMRGRIEKHRLERGALWETIEEPYEITKIFQRFSGFNSGLLVMDCATLWISNLLCGIGGKALRVEEIEKKFDDLLNVLSQSRSSIRIVSNEVGLALVPDHALGRQFRDLQGFLNQKLALQADQVFFMTAGLAQKLK